MIEQQKMLLQLQKMLQQQKEEQETDKTGAKSTPFSDTESEMLGDRCLEDLDPLNPFY